MTDIAAVPGTFSEIIQLVGEVIWPLTILILVLMQRKFVARMLSALALLAESANKIKVWQVEVERNIDREVQEAAQSAKPEKTPTIPKRDELAAARVGSLVSSVSASPMRDNLAESIRRKMVALASEYETKRAEMAPGPARTASMNAVVARMRALAVAARPFLPEFSGNDRSPGARLCAIAILQMTPDARYIDWLGQRFSVETPFVFYQAGVALAQAVSEIGSDYSMQLKKVIANAIATLESYRGGNPDPNSLSILKMTLEAMTRPETG